ncbi:MAG: substrate-binding domain-containing protein [Desulfotomaculaceae bacterium]|nr:substrate-binding domain-containing protein [Desulfotomaculaceae bacterium]
MNNLESSSGRGKLIIILFIMTIIPFLHACGKKEPQRKPVSNGGGQEIKIAVSLASMERDGNQIIKKTMNGRTGQNGQESGQNGQQSGQQSQQSSQGGQAVVPVQAQSGGDQQGQQQGGQQKINITWLDAGNDPIKQEKDLDQLAGQNIKAVILQAVDPTTAPNLVRKLAQSNIKVIAFETLPANAPVDGYIASDHARAGELEARYLLAAAQGKSTPMNTVLLMGDKNDQTSKEIASSVLDNLKNQAQVKVIQAKNHDGGDPQLATATLDQALVSSNNQIDAVVATDGRMAAATAEMLKNRGLSQRVITVGVGADQQASRALVAGDHNAEVDLMPEVMAQHAFDAAVGLATTGHWQYEKQVKNGDFDVPAKITPVRLVTKEESYLLEQRWGKLTGQEEQQGQQGGQQQGQQQEQQQGQQGQQQGQQQEQQQGQQGQQQGQQGQSKRKTTLRVTTQDGKTVEMQITGEIKKIETVDGTGGQEGGQSGGSSDGES